MQAVWRIRKTYMKGISDARSRAKAAKASEALFYPGAIWASKALGLYGLDQ
jgi:hypothetical protein